MAGLQSPILALTSYELPPRETSRAEDMFRPVMSYTFNFASLVNSDLNVNLIILPEGLIWQFRISFFGDGIISFVPIMHPEPHALSTS